MGCCESKEKHDRPAYPLFINVEGNVVEHAVSADGLAGLASFSPMGTLGQRLRGCFLVVRAE
eukprot:4639402-Pyramimonas_sp.AAC.1